MRKRARERPRGPGLQRLYLNSNRNDRHRVRDVRPSQRWKRGHADPCPTVERLLINLPDIAIADEEDAEPDQDSLEVAEPVLHCDRGPYDPERYAVQRV